VRAFELRPGNDGSIEFVMEETLLGADAAARNGSMPGFGPVFERYANDLKQEAER
jgi:hypothetical protein